MLETRRLELQSQMDAALAANDKARIEALRRTIDRETLECTAHTAERVKRIEKDVVEVKSDVREIKGALTATKHRIEGAKWLWDALKVLIGAGGGAALLKALGGA
ncbi:MAG: hypothetical protein IIZ06_07490 [Kiritimatiellae bacterium]|nr:hypothetical protein [Kiritimatiellia bacterium]